MDLKTGNLAKDQSTICGILSKDLPGYIDKNGCLKKEAHNDNHVFKDQNGKLVSWEDDYHCTCGCWEAWESGHGDLCAVFGEINSTCNF